MTTVVKIAKCTGCNKKMLAKEYVDGFEDYIDVKIGDD